MEMSGEVHVQSANGKWIALGHTAEVGILHIPEKVSAHADPQMVDGVWVCYVCDAESGDKQIFEEVGEWGECAKVATGGEKNVLGRYVANAEARKNFDRATKAIMESRDGPVKNKTYTELAEEFREAKEDPENQKKWYSDVMREMQRMERRR